MITTIHLKPKPKMTLMLTIKNTLTLAVGRLSHLLFSLSTQFENDLFYKNAMLRHVPCYITLPLSCVLWTFRSSTNEDALTLTSRHTNYLVWIEEETHLLQTNPEVEDVVVTKKGPRKWFKMFSLSMDSYCLCIRDVHSL